MLENCCLSVAAVTLEVRGSYIFWGVGDLLELLECLKTHRCEGLGTIIHNLIC
jgi:hypothetical protein